MANYLLSPFSSLTIICISSTAAESEDDEVAEAFDAERERMVNRVMTGGWVMLCLGMQ